jgi:hypothetical protein
MKRFRRLAAGVILVGAVDLVAYSAPIEMTG